MKKISVIIPIYNVEPYLDACLRSVVNQTYKNLEIIAVDDGSTDNSGKILDEWIKRDSRIIGIHKKGGGVSSARNIGLDMATGDYIVMIDSDDFWDTEAVELLFNTAVDNKADMVIARGKRVDEEGNLFSENLKDIAPHVEGIISEEDFWKVRPIDMFFVVPWSKIYRKELFDDIRFPEGRINEDVAVLWKIISKCERIYALDRKIYNWRINPNSITRSRFGYKNLFLAETLLEETEYIRTADISDEVKYLTLNNAFSCSMDILMKAYLYLEDSIQIHEADQIYLKYKSIARELRKNVGYGNKNSFFVFFQMTLYLTSKSGYFALRKWLKRSEK